MSKYYLLYYTNVILHNGTESLMDIWDFLEVFAVQEVLQLRHNYLDLATCMNDKLHLRPAYMHPMSPTIWYIRTCNELNTLFRITGFVSATDEIRCKAKTRATGQFDCQLRVHSTTGRIK